MRQRIIATTLVLLFSFATSAQDRPSGQKPAPKNRLAETRRDPCEAEKTKAHLEGWNAGYATGMEAMEKLLSETIGDNPKKLPISFVVEDIDGADSFHFAAAEVIRSQFSESLVIDPSANLALWIHGTNAGPIRPGTDFQGIALDVNVTIAHRLTAGDSIRTLVGQFTLAESSGTYMGYSREQRVQVVREMTYKVISEFFEKWKNAKT